MAGESRKRAKPRTVPPVPPAREEAASSAAEMPTAPGQTDPEMAAAAPVRPPRSRAELRRRQRTLYLSAGFGILALILIGAIAAAVSNTQSGGSCTHIEGTLGCGAAAPEFTLPQEPGGRPFSLSAYKGHPVLLEFFASWCEHCQHEAPRLENLYSAYHGKGLEMVSVVASAQDHLQQGTTSPADVGWFVNTFRVKHPMLYDPNVADPKLGEAAIFGIQGYPTIYLLDKDLIVRYSGSGEISLADLQTQILKLL